MLTHVHELLWEQINKLKNLGNNEVIVVEGKKDMRALRKLGIESKIFLLKNYKSLVEVSEILAKYDNVILMLDTDPTGRKLTKEMQNHIQAQGVKFDTKLGRTLLRMAHCRTVEGLASSEIDWAK